MIWAKDPKSIDIAFLFILQLLNYQYFLLKQNQLKKQPTYFQLNFSVLSYIKLLLVFIEFSKTGDIIMPSIFT